MSEWSQPETYNTPDSPVADPLAGRLQPDVAGLIQERIEEVFRGPCPSVIEHDLLEQRAGCTEYPLPQFLLDAAHGALGTSDSQR